MDLSWEQPSNNMKKDRSHNGETCEHLGHWLINTLAGARSHGDPVLLTFVDWETRLELILKIKQQSKDSVDKVIKVLRERLDKNFNRIFQMITADNGSVFTGLYGNLIRHGRCLLCPSLCILWTCNKGKST